MFFVSCVSHAFASVHCCLTIWLLLVMCIVFFVTFFPCGILGQVWFLIVSFPDLCRLSYFHLNFPVSESFTCRLIGQTFY